MDIAAIWMFFCMVCVDYLLRSALRRAKFVGDSGSYEFWSGSGVWSSLFEICNSCHCVAFIVRSPK